MRMVLGSALRHLAVDVTALGLDVVRRYLPAKVPTTTAPVVTFRTELKEHGRNCSAGQICRGVMRASFICSVLPGV